VSSPSDPQPSPTGDLRQPSTQEIPVVQPAGATAVTKQLPPHPDAAAPGPVDAAQPTGPVDFIPGLPGLGAPPVPPAAAPPATPAPPPPVPPTPLPPDPVQPAAAGAPSPTWPETLESEAVDGEGTRRRFRAPRLRAPHLRAPRIRAPRDRAALGGLGLVVLSVALLELGLTLGFGGESYWSEVTLWSAFATVCALLALLAFAAFYPAGNQLRSGPAWRVAAAGLVGLAVFWLLVVLPTVASDRGFVLTAALAALGGALWIGPRSKS
jgi:hypothetical protein